jgi:hypothetical protein
VTDLSEFVGVDNPEFFFLRREVVGVEPLGVERPLFDRLFPSGDNGLEENPLFLRVGLDMITLLIGLLLCTVHLKVSLIGTNA